METEVVQAFGPAVHFQYPIADSATFIVKQIRDAVPSPAGRLVAFPTETVYGLGADATDDRAVAALFAAKGRPRFNPLIAHVLDERAARAAVVFDDRAAALAAAFWPGPLTLVLRRRPDCAVSLLVSAGLDSLAVRGVDKALGTASLFALTYNILRLITLGG